MERFNPFCRPLLRTKGFSTLHVYIFELILLGKTNREINKILGYSQKSHMVVDHSKIVMRKLLSCEELGFREYHDQIVYPRKYIFWWKALLTKHNSKLLINAIEPQFYSRQVLLSMVSDKFNTPDQQLG